MSNRTISDRTAEALLASPNAATAPEPVHIDAAAAQESQPLDDTDYICSKQLAAYLLRLLNGEDELEAALETICTTPAPVPMVS